MVDPRGIDPGEELVSREALSDPDVDQVVRALAILISEETHRAARETVGHHHARRFDVAAALQPAERETVIAFLDALSDVQEVRTAPVAHG